MNEQLQFPAPEPGDPEDVAWTLQTAGTMWGRGDHHEAIRWLRRAAEAAGNSGADMRAVTLARAAADLTTALDIPPSIPPPAATPSEQVTQDPPLAAATPAAAPPPPSQTTHERPHTSRPSARPSGVRQRQALRVAVHPADSGNELTVRPLMEDESPAEGEHEAMLVALEAGAHLLSKKR